MAFGFKRNGGKRASAARPSVREPKNADKPEKPYVGDYGNPIEGAAEKVSANFGMVVLALPKRPSMEPIK